MTTTILADEAENGNGTPETLSDLLRAPSAPNDPTTWPRFADICRLFRFDDMLARELCGVLTADEARGFRVRPDQIPEIIGHIDDFLEWRLMTGFLREEDAGRQPLANMHTANLDRDDQAAAGLPVGVRVIFNDYLVTGPFTGPKGRLRAEDIGIELSRDAGLRFAHGMTEDVPDNRLIVGSVIAVELPGDR